jgi:YggT family protein
VTIVCTLLQLYLLALFGRIILSWFPLQPDSPVAAIYRFLFGITEPVLGPIRRIMPPIRMGTMGIDLSPIIVLVGIQILQGVICH